MTRPHPTPDGPSAVRGTPEELWRPWLADRPWPELTVPRWDDVLVCAAHPDDDVLAVGGLVRRLAAAGTRVHLLAATDGEGSHPGSTVVGPAELARRRVAETADALAALGVRPASVRRLGLPDAGLAAAEEELTAAVTAAAEEADAVLAPWSGDAHPDHDALGRAAESAAGALGRPLLAFPVWTWEWARPGDPRVPWARAARVPLDEAGRAAKRAAVACFRSQVAPLGPAPEDATVLPPAMLAHFDRSDEVVFR